MAPRDARPVTTDSAAENGDGWVQWTRDKDLRRVRSLRVQLRFTLRNVRIYSFRVADETTMKLAAPGGRPGRFMRPLAAGTILGRLLSIGCWSEAPAQP